MEDLLQQIEADAEKERPLSDGDLKLVSTLATKQMELLGPGIKKGPTGEAIQGLRDWAKKNGIVAPPELKGFSIAILIGALAERLTEYKQVSEVDLPNAMAALELTTFTLANGYKVEIAVDTRASVRADQWEGATEFLKEQGLADVIKNETKLNFDLDDSGIKLDTEIGRCLLNLAIDHSIIRLNGDQTMMIVTVDEPGEEEGQTVTKEVEQPIVLTRADAIAALAKEEGIVGEEKRSINAQTLKALVKEQRAKGVVFPEAYFSVQDVKKAEVTPPKEVKPKATKKK